MKIFQNPIIFKIISLAIFIIRETFPAHSEEIFIISINFVATLLMNAVLVRTSGFRTARTRQMALRVRNTNIKLESADAAKFLKSYNHDLNIILRKEHFRAERCARPHRS